MNDIQLAPIVLFVFNRLDLAKQTIEGLKNNKLANESELFIFSDASKHETEDSKVLAVRKYIRKVTGFKKVTIIEREKNFGLANNIIEGVTSILKENNKVIVMEDDLLTSPYFLNFMNEALVFYEENKNILSISGWSLKLNALKKYTEDIYFHNRYSSWSWGTWASRWEQVIFSKKNIRNLIIQKPSLIKNFNVAGSDLPNMLYDCLDEKNDSWAVRACFSQHINKKLTVCPSKTLVMNIGFSNEATHTKSKNAYDQIELSTLKQWKFIQSPAFENQKILKSSQDFYSIRNRIRRKILQFFI